MDWTFCFTITYKLVFCFTITSVVLVSLSLLELCLGQIWSIVSMTGVVADDVGELIYIQGTDWTGNDSRSCIINGRVGFCVGNGVNMDVGVAVDAGVAVSGSRCCCGGWSEMMVVKVGKGLRETILEDASVFSITIWDGPEDIIGYIWSVTSIGDDRDTHPTYSDPGRCPENILGDLDWNIELTS